ncbi:unnamed protein product [Ambrosiozyma monospora]|uniref:Unnamed protein product n=1 Tax=Ambrosiozyma monospora TaxID=43982 RepID=A0ACB5TX64_AMBMO|nr:unnamed protein product [Ambrosiozyma monospora]
MGLLKFVLSAALAVQLAQAASGSAASASATSKTTTAASTAATCSNDHSTANFMCHAYCGYAIQASYTCENDDGSYDSTCLCETSKFSTYIGSCLDCGWCLWDDYGKYLSEALAICDLPTLPTGTSCSPCTNTYTSYVLSLSSSVPSSSLVISSSVAPSSSSVVQSPSSSVESSTASSSSSSIFSSSSSTSLSSSSSTSKSSSATSSSTVSSSSSSSSASGFSSSSSVSTPSSIIASSSQRYSSVALSSASSATDSAATCGQTTAAYSCHAACGYAIKASYTCETEDGYDSKCLCETSSFTDTIDECLSCGWCLWQWYGNYLSAALPVCGYPTQPTDHLLQPPHLP